ncbi:hypothetical protein FACS1894123_06070 [Bacteroidia bacterium]|nr:hypothetical protein FACS1894123_06070 [Bacteroidia bacterium]
MMACDSVRKLSIEVQKPAAVTLPVSAQNVLILNNAVPQPSTYGITQTFNGVEIKDSCRIELDSIAWRTANIISKELKNSKFFNRVAIYREAIRSDNEWLTSYAIPKPIQHEFYDVADYDALMTIDRLIFAVKEDVRKLSDDDRTIKSYLPSSFPTPQFGYGISNEFPELGHFTNIRVEGMLTCSFYVPNTDKPFKTISISDSLFFINGVENELSFIYKKIPEIIIAEICQNMAQKIASCFFPTWERADRLVFMNSYARMKEANVYSLSEKWDKAKELWIAEFESQKKPISKARIASNIALACEMMDDIETALDWATKAKDFFVSSNKNGQHTAEIEFIEKYVSELETRIENNNLIDLQVGVKD